jgi:hypothetical protein
MTGVADAAVDEGMEAERISGIEVVKAAEDVSMAMVGVVEVPVDNGTKDVSMAITGVVDAIVKDGSRDVSIAMIDVVRATEEVTMGMTGIELEAGVAVDEAAAAEDDSRREGAPLAL